MMRYKPYLCLENQSFSQSNNWDRCHSNHRFSNVLGSCTYMPYSVKFSGNKNDALKVINVLTLNYRTKKRVEYYKRNGLLNY